MWRDKIAVNLIKWMKIREQTSHVAKSINNFCKLENKDNRKMEISHLARTDKWAKDWRHVSV